MSLVFSKTLHFWPDLADASSTTVLTLSGDVGLSELTICLIVLPVVIVFLVAVLLCVALPKNGRSKSTDSAQCCFRRGRSANVGGEGAALTISTAASSPASTMNQVIAQCCSQQDWQVP